MKIKEFTISGSIVKGISGDVSKYRNLLINGGFDIVTNFAAQQWATDLTFEVLKNIPSKKVMVPTCFSNLLNQSYRDYFISMKKWMKMYDTVVCLSTANTDYKFAMSSGMKKVTIIPNGASKAEFVQSKRRDIKKILGIPENYTTILSVGTHTGYKGHNLAMKIFKKAMIHNSCLLIVGNSDSGGCSRNCKIYMFVFNSTNLSRKKMIKVIELRRDELVDIYHQADVFLLTSNYECNPIVIYESLASRTPFLSSDVGNVDEIAEKSHAGLILPTKARNGNFVYCDIEKSAYMLEKLINDPQLRHKMSTAGFRYWLKNNTWEMQVERYEGLYTKLLSS